MTSLSESQIERYARQIVLPEIGGIGQSRLLASSVLVVGAGGLGCPLALYLAGAGIGRIGIVDDDRIEAGNLHRQIAYRSDQIGGDKAATLAAQLGALNPDCRAEPHLRRLTGDNADSIVTSYDIIADGTDNIATRRIVHDSAMRQGKSLVSASVQGMDGQLTIYRAFADEQAPCLHCHEGGQTAEAYLPSCASGGVLGPAAGIMAGMQATEIVKLIVGAETDLIGRLLLFDARTLETFSMQMARRANCEFCSNLPQK